LLAERLLSVAEDAASLEAWFEVWVQILNQSVIRHLGIERF
jgi:hypothetical protein